MIEMKRERMEKKILELASFESTATRYLEEQVGSVRVKRIRYPRGIYYMYDVNGYEFFHIKKAISITTLQEKRKRKWLQWMVDDPPHFYSMLNYGKEAKGRVLVAGLGLGMLAEALVNNPNVTEVTVVEINQEVIGLIGKYVKHPKLKIVCANFYDFVKQGGEYDYIIVDIWVSGSRDETMHILFTEVLNTHRILRKQFPNSRCIYHGFGNCIPIFESIIESEKVLHERLVKKEG